LDDAVVERVEPGRLQVQCEERVLMPRAHVEILLVREERRLMKQDPHYHGDRERHTWGSGEGAVRNTAVGSGRPGMLAR